jgi:arylsulfatase A-like enzyme
MRAPNIIFILCDDLGWGDLGCYGQQTLKTPHVDALAAEGLRCTDFYTTSPVCSPARASIMTGLHSGHLPIRHLDDPYMPDDLLTIAKLFHKAGYTSTCTGKYGVGNSQPHDDALKKGFDHHYGYNCMRHAHNFYPPWLLEDGRKFFLRNRPPSGDQRQWDTGVGVAEVKIDYTPDLVENEALAFIEANQHRPFFLHYCTNLPHANNEGGDSPDGMEVDTYGEFANTPWKDNEKGFARMIQRIDQTVGKVVAKVRELGLEQDTIILFSSDNGPHQEGGHAVKMFESAGPFQGYKRSLHEGGIRVPFIVWGPGRIPGGRVSSLPGYFPDLLNTFSELIGLPTQGPSDGHSLAALWQGREHEQVTHPYLYFEYLEQIAVREGRYKFYRATDGSEALYDLESDPHEDTDISSSNPERFARLRSYIAIEHRDYAATPVMGGAIP